MKLSAFITFSFFLTHFVYSQTGQFENKHYDFSSIIGIARAKFKVTGVSTEEYPALEVRLGGGISRNFGSRIQIRSGLNICLRAKRKSYLINGNYYGKGMPVLLLDETASKRNHIALEIPLSIKLLFNGMKFNVSAGFMGRFWQPTSLSGDILRSNREIGYIAGVNQRISSNLTIGLDFYLGLNSLYPGYLVGQTRYTVKNRFAQVTLEYTFKKQLKKNSVAK